jgi:hypothetical protein
MIFTRERRPDFNFARLRKAAKPPGKNWPRGFQKRHPALKSRRVRAMAWERHENNIYDKIIHWFEVIRKVLQDPAILPENVYNMDETGVMLCMLSSIKVLISKDDPRDYRGAGVKRTMVTAISWRLEEEVIVACLIVEAGYLGVLI